MVVFFTVCSSATCAARQRSVAAAESRRKRWSRQTDARCVLQGGRGLRSRSTRTLTLRPTRSAVVTATCVTIERTAKEQELSLLHHRMHTPRQSTLEPYRLVDARWRTVPLDPLQGNGVMTIGADLPQRSRCLAREDVTSSDRWQRERKGGEEEAHNSTFPASDLATPSTTQTTSSPPSPPTQHFHLDHPHHHVG